MNVRIALDTNILVYAEGVGDERKHDIAVNLIERIENDNIIIPA